MPTKALITDSERLPDEAVKQLQFKRENGIIVLMDCRGSNAAMLNEQMPRRIKLIATARPDTHPECRAGERAREILGDEPVLLDIEDYERKRGIVRGDYFKALKDRENAVLKGSLGYQEVIKAREEWCREFAKLIESKKADLGIKSNIPVFAAGFMQLLSPEFVDAYFIVNVHPGDLTKYDNNHKRILTGDGYVPSSKALKLHHDSLYSSTHLMSAAMDEGPVFMRGYPLPLDYKILDYCIDLEDKDQLGKAAVAAQEILKHIGDHVIAGATFQDLFDGNWGRYENGLAYRFHNVWYNAPDGITIEDHVLNNPGTKFQRDQSSIEGWVNYFYRKVYDIKK